MRDKNLNYQMFHIQFKKNLLDKLQSNRFLRSAVAITPTFLESQDIIYPRKFRLLRALAILQWYLPDTLHWRILLDLLEMKLSFLNEKQILEIEILSSSETNMLKFLYETRRYTSHEIFGNILQDCLECLESLKLIPRSRKVSKTQRKRGYDDKGTRKPDWKWLPSSDFLWTEEQNRQERKLDLHTKTLNRILLTLESQQYPE